MMGQRIETARNCIECGECMEKCPYKLNIPNLLKEKLIIWDRYISENASRK